jgi:hypothetical protein
LDRRQSPRSPCVRSSAAQPLGITLGGYSRSFAITSLIVWRAGDAIRESRIASQRPTGCLSHQSH